MNLNWIITRALVVFFIFCWSIDSTGQVLNVDRENGQDTIKKKFRASLDLSVSLDKQRSDLFDLTNAAEFSYFTKKNTTLIFLSRTELVFNGSNTIENNGYFQLRYRDNDKRKIYPDFFTQYQWNGIQGMEHRAIAGVNMRVQWMEKRKSDLYSSVGIFYEMEKWNPFMKSYAFSKDTMNIVYRNMFRLNTVLKFAFKIGPTIDFAGVSYVQFPLNDKFLQPRWFVDLNLNVPVSKHFSFVVHYEHNYDAFRPLPIDKFYYALTLGCRFTF